MNNNFYPNRWNHTNAIPPKVATIPSSRTKPIDFEQPKNHGTIDRNLYQNQVDESNKIPPKIIIAASPSRAADEIESDLSAVHRKSMEKGGKNEVIDEEDAGESAGTHSPVAPPPSPVSIVV